MSKKIKVEDLPTFDPAEHLKDDADIAAYLSLVIDEGDAGELAHALARGRQQRARVQRRLALPLLAGAVAARYSAPLRRGRARGRALLGGRALFVLVRDLAANAACG